MFFLNVFVFFPRFYLNYGEVRRRRSSVLGFLNDSLFHRWSCYFFFTLVRLSFISVLQGKRYIIFYSRLPQSFDQNTKKDKTPCSRVSGKNKENISLQSNLSLSLSLSLPLSLSLSLPLFFHLKNVFGAGSNQASQKLNSRTAIFDVERKALQCFFQRRYGRNRKSYWYVLHREIIICSL